MVGVLFLVGWNVVLVFGEYYFFWIVFKVVVVLFYKVIDIIRYNFNIEDNFFVDMFVDEFYGFNECLERMENED